MVRRPAWMLALACLFGAAALSGAAAQSKPKKAAGAPSAMGVPDTIQEALALAYATNPTLQTSRAQLRATDENVPKALAGWRPTIVISASAGKGYGYQTSTQFGQQTATSLSSTVDQVQGTLTQPVYTGGKVPAQLHQARNQVYATRAQLLASEETVLFNSAQAYVNVVQDEQLLQIDINNEKILTKQLQSTNDRFRVGELTRTDVAQAEASLASATAQRETAEGTLQAARATYEQYIGVAPPAHLSPPQPLRLPVRTIGAAQTLAGRNNPNVVSALFNDAAAHDAFDVAYAALMPNVGIQITGVHNKNSFGPGFAENGGQLLGTLSLPIYQGGSEYATIRQARQQEIQARKQLEDQRRTAVQLAASAWEQLAAARASIASNRSAVRANEIAVEGLEREALVGSRTTLDVLIGIQSLLTAETSLVQSLASLVTSSYQVAQAVGRLTARDLNLNVPLYDDTAYYRAVRNLWIGTGNYATQDPGH